MKTLPFLAAFTSTLMTSLIATADCTQTEAQFIGKIAAVVDLVRIDQGQYDCAWKLEFTQFSPSFICPLDIDEAMSAKIPMTDGDCMTAVGQQVSGVLVQKDGKYFID